MLNDIRFAFRQLVNNPAFSAIAILTLALGVGANTAIFSIVNAVLLRPLPYPDADRIMVLNESSGPGQDYSVALPDYFDWQKDNTVFEHLAATHKESRNLSGIAGRDPERVSCAAVTRNFFNIIGLPPQIGRTFSEEEDKVGAPPVVVISDRLWQRAFNRDAKILGQAITLHDQSYTVIGVMPRQMTSPQDTDVWLSMIRRSNNGVWMSRTIHPMIYVWGKLKPRVTVEQTRTEMKGIAARLEKTYPDTNRGETAVVTPLLDNLVGKYRTNLGLLLGAVGLVLLIACANLANLFAARGAARAREFAIHAAVGATRGQIIKKLLIESFVVALLGGALGFLFAVWVRNGLVALSPDSVLQRGYSITQDADTGAVLRAVRDQLPVELAAHLGEVGVRLQDNLNATLEGDVTLFGPPLEPVVGGSVTLSRMTYTEDIDVERSLLDFSRRPPAPRVPGGPLPQTTRVPPQVRPPPGPPPNMTPTSSPAVRPAARAGAKPAAARPQNIFADDSRPVEAPHDDLPTLFAEELISEKSLDEVILAFLSADLEPPK